MSGTDKAEWSLSDLHLDSAALEPLPEAQAKPAVAEGRAQFKVDTRSGKERRVLPDRRKELRFEPDRRSGKDRRPHRTWEPGHNL